MHFQIFSAGGSSIPVPALRHGPRFHAIVNANAVGYAIRSQYKQCRNEEDNEENRFFRSR